MTWRRIAVTPPSSSGTPAQIAELLNVSDGTVRKQLARARDHLRRSLDA